MRCNYLAIGWVKIRLQKVLEILEISDLTCNSEPLTICGTTLIENLNGLIAMINCLIKDQISADGKTGPAFARLAVDRNHASRVVC